MDRIRNFTLTDRQAAFWFLGQAGYVFRAAGTTVVIDPYLSNSGGVDYPECTRLLPIPLEPASLQADIYVVTHNHLDHLDPESIRAYRHAGTTTFVAPHLTARQLEKVGVPKSRIKVVDVGDEAEILGVKIQGTFALPTGADVLDTCGYRFEFANQRTIWHTSDTAFTELLLEAAPKEVDVLLLPINGKWRNLNVEQACRLTEAVRPRFVVPNHYDMMAVNTENPESFRFILSLGRSQSNCVIARVMEPFAWE